MTNTGYLSKDNERLCRSIQADCSRGDHCRNTKKCYICKNFNHYKRTVQAVESHKPRNRVNGKIL